MMTPQEAIERIEEFGLHHAIGDLPHSMRTVEAFEMAINALKQQEKSRWIPVTEKLPEEHKWIGTECFKTTISDEVYVTIEVPSGDRIVEHLCFQNGAIPSHKQRELDAFYKGGKPIAWRPLPEPYKEDNDDTTGSNRQG